MKPSVLLVDDEPSVRQVLTEMLSESGVPALEAGDASEALNTLRKAGRDICVMVTDVRMPGFLNGLDLAKFVQNSWPWVKVIVMSGFVDSVDQELPANVRFLAKPWKPDQMMSNILGAADEFRTVQKIGSLH
jgi:DNA-binding NtrC family response regulator